MDIKRAELIKQLIEKHNYTKKAATAVVDDFMDIIIDNLSNGNDVKLRDFGNFEVHRREARRCPDPLNPNSEKRYEIPAHMVPRFTPGKKMRRVVKIWEDNVKRGLA